MDLVQESSRLGYVIREREMSINTCMYIYIYIYISLYIRVYVLGPCGSLGHIAERPVERTALRSVAQMLRS